MQTHRQNKHIIPLLVLSIFIASVYYASTKYESFVGRGSLVSNPPIQANTVTAGTSSVAAVVLSKQKPRTNTAKATPHQTLQGSATSTSTSTPSAKESGISGTVTIGPTCPVQTDNGNCGDVAYPTTLKLYTQGGDFIQTINVDVQGTFVVSVPPGKYTIKKTSTTNYPRLKQIPTIVVSQNSYINIHLQFDTGIR